MAELTSNRTNGYRGKDKNRMDQVNKIDSRMLLGRDGRIMIHHKGQYYELRETRFGKLILTK